LGVKKTRKLRSFAEHQSKLVTTFDVTKRQRTRFTGATWGWEGVHENAIRKIRNVTA